MAKKPKPLPTIELMVAGEHAAGIYDRMTINLAEEIAKIVPPKKITPKFLAAVQRQLDDWQENLPAELDRIAGTALAAMDRNETEHQAIRLLWLVNDLRSIKDKQRQRDILRGYFLGRTAEQLEVLPLEHVAKIGQRKRRKSQQTAIDTNKKRAERRPDYKAAVRARMASGMKFDPACEQVAADLGTTKQTVRTHTRELWPRSQK